MSAFAEEWLVAGGLFAALAVALESGFRLGRRSRSSDAGNGSAQVSVIQSAVLGMLGLLLAFSFAAAGTRFLERQDLIVSEANAIGTAYLRAELLDEPQRAELRSALAAYTEHRVAASRRLTDGWAQQLQDEVEQLHERVWRAARDGVAKRPDMSMAVLPPVNEVIDLHAMRVAASRKHVPTMVMALLVICSLLSILMIGFGCGLDDRRRWPLTLSLVVLTGCSLWITIDLDYPRWGSLRLSDAALQALKFDPR